MGRIEELLEEKHQIETISQKQKIESLTEDNNY